ncbi:DUF2156 domain-containing protein, partial [bacterium]|nr:DUF2156 domain-containing protein [bacterium]
MTDYLKIERALKYLLALIPLIIFPLVLWILYREMRSMQLSDILGAVYSTSLLNILTALVLTILSYLVLTFYDLLAVRHLSLQVPYRNVLVNSFISTAISYTVGFNILTSGSLRYRLYSLSGVSPRDVARLIGFSSLSIWLGYFFISGSLFFFYPLHLPPTLAVQDSSVRLVGLLLLAVFVSYIIWAVAIRRFRWRNVSLQAPPVKTTFLQVAVACPDWVIAAMVLYALIPSNLGLNPFQLIGFFLLAQLAGLISNVPGGLGVFETTMMVMLQHSIDPSILAGVLIIYRVVYYLLPFLLALTLLAFVEAHQQKLWISSVAKPLAFGFSKMIPLIFSVLTFSAGIILLFSGVTPSIMERLHWLIRILPLPAIELSHFLGSVAGTTMLLLALGLKRRLSSAYFLSLAMLLAGSLISIFKSVDYEEAGFLFAIFMALLPCRRYFYSQSSIWQMPHSKEWLVGTLMVLFSATWLGLFSYRHVEYAHELWWQFSLAGEAPRYLRATVGMFSIILITGLISLVRRKPPLLNLPSESDLDSAQSVLGTAGDTHGNLALLGDKFIFFSPNKRAFIMYGISGNSWISMGDPVGDPAEFKELIWQFREMSHEHYDRVVFYEVGTEYLP